MLLSSLLLLLFGGATATFHFEIDGHFSEIAVSDVDVAPSRRDHFLPAESKLREKMFDLFKGQLDEFYVHTFSIHGQDLHPSAIFTAFLSTPLPRAKVIHLVSQDEDLDFFRVRELAGLPSPPIPSNSDAVSSCQNGGYLLPNNSCACPAFFVGESCEVVTCLNGGISDRGRCACPPGAYALNCEQRGCLPSTQADLDFSRSSFILVVSQKSTMAYVLNQLANSLGILLGDIFADARFDSYIVVNYVHTKNSLQMSTNVFKRYGDLSNYLNTLVYGLQGREKQPTQRAVLQAQSFYPLMKAFSDVFVFTDSLDEDAMPASYFLSNMTIENQLILQTLAWRNKIHYYFSENGGENLYDKGDGYDTFVRVAKATLGDIFNYPMTEIRTLMNTIDFYNGCQTLAAAYNVTNELTFDLRIPGGSEQGPIFVFLTVAAGTLPKVTDGSRRAMNPILNGSRYEVYNTTSLNKQIIVHPGGKLVSLRACISSGETMLLSAAYSEDTDVGTVYLSANYNNHLTGLSVGNQDYINQVQWLNLQNQQPLSDSVRIGEPRTIECTYNVAFNSLGPCLSMTMGQEVSMTSDKGEIVTRLLPGFCLNMDKQEVQLFMCHNGGTREGVKVCRCTAEWEGPQCETPVCKNKGKTNNFPGNGFGPCSCAPGFSGDHCSVLNCTVPTSYPPPPPTATLALVLQSSLSQASVAPTVDSGVADLLRSMKGDEQYDQFVLTTFSFERTPEQIKNVISTTSFTDSAAFQTAVNSVRYLSTPSTTQDSLGALMSTFNNSMTNSALFLFVDADPWDTSRLPDVLTMSVERNVPINVVVTAPFGLMDQCMTGVSQLFYENLAMKSGGVVLNLCQKTIQRYPQDPIYALFVGYAASHHRTEIINQEFYADFELIPTVFFPVDQPGNDVFVIVNCPKTESVATSIENHDLGFPTPTGSVVYMPFLAVYKVATTAVNKNGYTATVSKSGTSVDGPCNVQAVIKSNHAAHLRFSPNPSFDALQGAIDFAIPTFPVFHISNPKLNRTYSPTLVATDDKGSFTYVGDSLTRTNSCTFEYWFQQEFTCTKPADSFVLRFSGMTTDGNAFMRSLRGYCFLETGLCANGGYKLSNGLCKCPQNFGGAYCQSPKCDNGFSLNPTDFECMCSPKYTGQFCETPVCNNWNFMESVDPRSSLPKQITFVLNKNVDSLLVNVQLSSIIQSVVTATESQSVPVLYSLVVYDQYDVQRVISTSHAGLFVSYFQNTVNGNQTQSALTTKSIDALGDAYKLNIQAPGVVFLFMGSPASTPSLNSLDNFLEQKINTQVNVFYTPQKSGSYPSVPTDPQTSQLIQAVRQSGGRYLPLTQNSVSQMTQMLVSSTRTKQLAFDYALENCNEQCTYNFDMESRFRHVEVTIKGIDVAVPGNVKVLDGQKKALSLSTDTVLFKDNQVLVLRFNSSMATGGQWTIDVKTAFGASLVQVRVDSDIKIFSGFTIDKFDDFVHQLPFTGLGLNRSTYMTFRVAGPSVVLNKVNVYKTTFNQPQLEGLVDSLFLIRRDTTSCAYQYVSSEWNVDISAQQKFVLLGTDSNDVIFTRTFFYQFPLLNQRAATCLHGTHDSYGQCVCSDKTKWTGDYCQEPVCHNGGTPSYGICICVNGYYGDFCEDAVTRSFVF